jgi:transcriptional regulator with XRE-family HTH domain
LALSRLGELLRTERMRRKMTLRDVARAGGVSEKYLQEVEEGKRIIADEQARRILKKMGLNEHNEPDFTMDDIAAAVDLHTVAPAAVSPKKKNPEPAEAEIAYSDGKGEKAGAPSGVWLDALTSVLRHVPVYNAVMKEIDHRLLPVLDGRIEGAAPDKVFYFSAPDDAMRGFRILRDDLCLIVPSASPIDGAVMLVDHGGRRSLRKIKKLDAMNVLLQSYDREYSAEPCALPDVSFVGRAVRVEFTP